MVPGRTPGHHVGMTADRPNSDLALIVDLALLRVDKLGVRGAAAFMASRGASFALTCRVLAEPARRRTPAPSGLRRQA
jgi:hypothetical protein